MVSLDTCTREGKSRPSRQDDQAQLDANAPKGEVILLDVDPETGETKEATFFVLADGSLQPKP